MIFLICYTERNETRTWAVLNSDKILIFDALTAADPALIPGTTYGFLSSITWEQSQQ